MQKFTFVATLLLALLVAACRPSLPEPPQAAVASTPLNDLVSYQAQGRETPTPIAQEVIDSADAGYLLLQNIYDRVTPSVVNIDVTADRSESGFIDQSSAVHVAPRSSERRTRGPSQLDEAPA